MKAITFSRSYFYFQVFKIQAKCKYRHFDNNNNNIGWFLRGKMRNFLFFFAIYHFRLSLETKHYPRISSSLIPGDNQNPFLTFPTTILRNRLNLYTLLKRVQQITSKRFPSPLPQCCWCSIFLDVGERSTHPRVIHRRISRPWGSGWSVNRRCHRQRGEDGRAFLLGDGRRTTWLSSLEHRQGRGRASEINFYLYNVCPLKMSQTGRITLAKFTSRWRMKNETNISICSTMIGNYSLKIFINL